MAMAQPDTVKGGYRSCTVYHYEFKNGKIDTTSKDTLQICKYNDKGFQIYSQSNEIGLSITQKYKYDYNDRRIEDYSYHNDFLNAKGTYKYNEFGKIIEESKYSFPDSSVYTKRYTYNKYNDLDSMHCYHNHSQLSKTIYKYDNKLHLIEEISFENDSGRINSNDSLSKTKRSYEYDKNGRLISFIQFYNDVSIIAKTKKEYFDNGNLKESIFYSYFGHDQLNPKEYISKFDDKGYLIEDCGYGRCGVDKFTNFYRYDKQGNQIEIKTMMNNSEVSGKSYLKYDKFNNIIDCVRFDAENNPISKIVYEYSK